MPGDPSDFRLPDLRLVDLDQLIPHEQEDQRRSGALKASLREAGVLRNPPIVAEAPNEGGVRYVVLDGANRVSTLRSAGYPHLAVQVVAYDEGRVRLSTWHHALASYPATELVRDLASIPGLGRRELDLSHARALLARREAIAFVARPSGAVLALQGGETLHQRNALLNAVVDRYRSGHAYHRVTRDSIDEARSRYPDVTALVVFPRFNPDEIVEVAMSGARLPAGITRHVIAWRALRVNLPLDLMADRSRTLDDKNAWLRRWLTERMESNRVRFYEESTVLFDE